MQRLCAVAVVLALTACGGPSDTGELRPFVRSEGAPAAKASAALQLQVAQAADYERAEESLAPGPGVAAPNLVAALESLDSRREAAGEPPMLFARAVHEGERFQITPLDTRAWFDAHGRWIESPRELVADLASTELARGLRPIGAHLAPTAIHSTAPAVVSKPGIPALAIVDAEANLVWVNPQLIALLPNQPLVAATPPPTLVAPPTSMQAGNAAAAAAAGFSGVTGSGRFDGDGSVAACVTRESNRCRDCLTSGGCAPVFPGEDGATECSTWSSNNTLGLYELCCAGLLARSGAAACVAGLAGTSCPTSPTALTSSSTLGQDATFAGSASCRNALDQCLPSSGAGGTSVPSEAPAAACGACDTDFGGCAQTADDCANAPAEACGSFEDGCSGNSEPPPTGNPDNAVTSGITGGVTGSGSGSGASSATTGNPTTGSGSPTTGSPTTGELTGGIASGGTTAGGSATGGEVTGGSGGGTDIGSGIASGAATGSAAASGASGGSGSDSSGCGSDSCDSCTGDSSSCGSGADCSGGAGDASGCSTAGSRSPHKPWKPVHEATFAAIAPVLALLVRRKR